MRRYPNRTYSHAALHVRIFCLEVVDKVLAGGDGNDYGVKDKKRRR